MAMLDAFSKKSKGPVPGPLPKGAFAGPPANSAAPGQHIDKKAVEAYQKKFALIREEMKKAVVGQGAAVNTIIMAMATNGHVLIEGYPGVAKTLLMMSMATLTGCKYKRVQFTPDMLPTDITGSTSYMPDKGFYVTKGPIFTNFVLADEINRAPARVQSAMLEAMQERKVTIGTTTYPMEAPFIVMATQNNVETLGVYTIPAAQLDRFMFKIGMTYPEEHEEAIVLNRNITSGSFEDLGLRPVITPGEIVQLQKDVMKVHCAKEIEGYIVSLVRATRDKKSKDVKLARFIEYGASPRASIGLYQAAKASALLDGRTFVTPQDVKNVAHDMLRHRITLNYEGQAAQVSVDALISEILDRTAVP